MNNFRGGEEGGGEIFVGFSPERFNAGNIVDAQHNWLGRPEGLVNPVQVVDGVAETGLIDASNTLTSDPFLSGECPD